MQEPMNLFVTIIGALVIVFSPAPSTTYGCKKMSHTHFGGLQLDYKMQEIDDHMADMLWNYCGMDLMQTERIANDPIQCTREDAYAMNDYYLWDKRISSKQKIRIVMSFLHPHMKKSFLECLVKKKLLVPVSAEEGYSDNRHVTYIEFLPFKYDTSRRKLASESCPNAIMESPPSPSSEVDPSTSNPTPYFKRAPLDSVLMDPEFASPPLSSIFRPDVDNVSPPPPSHKKSHHKPTSHPATETTRNNRDIGLVIVVATTALLTFLVALLCFFCYYTVGSRDHKSDKRPLLSLSLNDHSFGSSNSNSNGSVNSFIGNDKLDNGSLNLVAKEDDKVSSQKVHAYVPSFPINAAINQSPSSENLVEFTNKLSTNSSNISTNSMNSFLNPPLKPPPGRVVNAPPPPPPPIKASMPPPPPPAPPFKTKSIGLTSITLGPPPPLKSHVGNPGRGAPPPPPPKRGPAPPKPPLQKYVGSRPPLGLSHSANATTGNKVDLDAKVDVPRTKLKPFFWDKVLANPDSSMVWNQIKSGSFQFNEEMMETLFGYIPPDQNIRSNRTNESSSKDPSTQYIQLIDSKKSHNISILLKALNVTTEEVQDVLLEGNELPIELLQTLMKMAPTTEEELKLRLFTGEVSRLGPAERFLKSLVDIPFAFKRLEALLFWGSFQEEASTIKESFATLEVACKELRNSRLFLKLLEAVLKTGNRMNDGTFRGGAQAFKLDTLLKLSDVKGKDGKTTLLHFVVLEIIRSEGIRAERVSRESRTLSDVSLDGDVEAPINESEEHFRSTGLQVVSGLSGELHSVQKAASLDAESLTGTVSRFGHSLIKVRDFLHGDMANIEEDSGFHSKLKCFVRTAEADIMYLLEEEKRIMALVKSTGDYFHGNAAKDEGLRLFVIVRDFLIMLDRVCNEVKNSTIRASQSSNNEERSKTTAAKPSEL